MLRTSQLAEYQGGTFRIVSACPEPGHSTRLESNLFRSPVLMPARISKQISWTVSVGPKQRPGGYWISLNCFRLLTGRVDATAGIRVRVMASPLKVMSRHDIRGQRRDPPGSAIS